MKIVVALLLGPIVLLGFVWGVIWISFCAGMATAEYILDKILKP